MTSSAYREHRVIPAALSRDRRSGRGAPAGGTPKYFATVLFGAAALSAFAVPVECRGREPRDPAPGVAAPSAPAAPAAPMVTGVTLSSEYPANGADGAFIAGDRILVTVTFSNMVTGTGAPRIALTIGDVTRYAHDDRIGFWISTTLEFLYEVQSEDLDNDGISIGATALESGDGPIRDWSDYESGDEANLSLTGHTITDDTDFIVNGGGADVRAPTVHTVTIQGCNRFIENDVIQAMVTFTEPVTVIGTPRLALTIGDATRYADLTGPVMPGWLEVRGRFGLGADGENPFFESVWALYFIYLVRSSDRDDLGDLWTTRMPWTPPGSASGPPRSNETERFGMPLHSMPT